MEEYLDRLDAPPGFHYPGVFEKVIGNSDAKYPPGHKNEIIKRMQASAVFLPYSQHS